MDSNTELLEILNDKVVTVESVKKLTEMVKTHPLIIEKNFNVIFSYLQLIDSDKFKKEFEDLLIAIFEVFSKLHRVQNLIAKIIPAMKSYVEENPTKKLNIHNVLPEPVLQYFTQCITPMASWQVINLMKTLLFHLESTISDEILNIGEDYGKIFYIEYISTLMCQLLSSVRMAEHTVSSLVITKVVNAMEDLKLVLGKFGSYLVNMEHNPFLMGAFLKLAYTWAELYIILAYYSIDKEVSIKLTIDNDYSACNITYLHSYLTVSQWCLISQRIANFGEKPCKHLMEKLFVQKIRAMTIFQEEFNEEIIGFVVKSIPVMEENFEEIILSPYMLEKFIPKMQTPDIIDLAGIMLQNAIDNNDVNRLKMHCISDSDLLTRALACSCISKINKTFKKQKRKLDANKVSFVSSKICKDIDGQEFVCNTNNFEEQYKSISSTFVSELQNRETSSNEVQISDTVENCLNILKALPVVYFPKNIQSTIFIYLSSLLSDINNIKISNQTLKEMLENLLLGILQHGDVDLSIINLDVLHKFFIDNFVNYKFAYEHILACLLKKEDTTPLKQDVEYLIQHLTNEKYLQCAIMLLNSINKFKKLKTITGEDKNILNGYRNAICDGIINVLLEGDKIVPDVIESYAVVLKYALTVDASDKSNKLIKNLEKYIAIAMGINCGDFLKGKLLLFAAVLLNKTKINLVNDDLIINMWKSCYILHIPQEFYEEYSKLVVLIFEHISNEKISFLASDLLDSLNEARVGEKWNLICDHLQIMTFILQCSFNPAKSQIWQDTTEFFLQDMVTTLSINESIKDMEALFNALIPFCIKMIQSTHHLLSPIIIDMLLIICSLFITRCSLNFVVTFSTSISILESLLKYRKPLIMDRLPSYLQQYRLLLKELCRNSDTSLNLDVTAIQNMSNCSHQMEKLTTTLATCTKDMARISPYLICDILKEFSQVSLYSNVKLHLTTCVYSLLSLCDKHAIAFLTRTTTCTEIFKVLYENYSKVKYTGKV